MKRLGDRDAFAFSNLPILSRDRCFSRSLLSSIGVESWWSGYHPRVVAFWREWCCGSDRFASYHVCADSNQGVRWYMEDEYLVRRDMVAVFDGHGGGEVSAFLRDRFYRTVQKTLRRHMASKAIVSRGRWGPTAQDYRDVLRIAIDKLDRQVLAKEEWSEIGSTIVVVWFYDAKSHYHSDVDVVLKGKSIESSRPARTMVIANVGDSRAVLSRNGRAVDLTIDHHPNDPFERDRIESMGGYVTMEGNTFRVNGCLAMSRAIGDKTERPIVVADPDLTLQSITDMDDFVVIATDGLWNVMSSAQVVQYIHMQLGQIDGYDWRSVMATLVVKRAIELGSPDNVAVIIVFLDGAESRARNHLD